MKPTLRRIARQQTRQDLLSVGDWVLITQATNAQDMGRVDCVDNFDVAVVLTSGARRGVKRWYLKHIEGVLA